MKHYTNRKNTTLSIISFKNTIMSSKIQMEEGKGPLDSHCPDLFFFFMSNAGRPTWCKYTLLSCPKKQFHPHKLYDPHPLYYPHSVYYPHNLYCPHSLYDRYNRYYPHSLYDRYCGSLFDTCSTKFVFVRQPNIAGKRAVCQV